MKLLFQLPMFKFVSEVAVFNMFLTFFFFFALLDHGQ